MQSTISSGWHTSCSKHGCHSKLPGLHSRQMQYSRQRRRIRLGNAFTPSTTSQSAYKSSLGRGSVLPNLYWTAIPHTHLRHYHPSYVGLPPVDPLQITTPSTYRYIRQSHESWRALHVGRLTTGQLAAALGLQEPGSASAVGAHKCAGALAGAYDNLMQPAWQPTMDAGVKQQQHAAAGSAMGGVVDGDAVAHNEEQRSKLHHAKMPESSLPAHGLWSAGASNHAHDVQANKRQVCEQVALHGEVACRLQWGQLQEAAALDALTQVYPSSMLEEVGMLHVDGVMLSERMALGCDPNELPALGASPDGLICHWLPITAEQMRHAQEQLQQATHSQPTVHLPGIFSSDTLPLKPRDVALQLILAALDSLTSPSLGSASSAAPSPLAGTDQRTLLPLTYSNDDSLTWLTSLLTSTSNHASCASVTHATTSESSAGSLPVGIQPGLGSTPATAPCIIDAQGTAWLPWREVVEVKNHCPFALLEHRKAKHGRTMLQYAVREYPPLQRLRAAWLPQLQWHCMAAGTHTALLLSRTPSKGIALFRVHRDDDFLMLALRTVHHVHAAYSSRGLQPPADIMRSPELNMQHKAIINAIRHLAGTSQLATSRPGHASQAVPLTSADARRHATASAQDGSAFGTSGAACPMFILPSPGSDANALWHVDGR